jgi:hypothetical protein
MNGHNGNGNGNGKHPPLTARELREQARQLNRRADELRTEAGYLIMQAVRLESVYRALEAELDVAMAAAVKEVGDPLTPRTWCRCALALVKDWAVDEHDLGYLELVLTYFIAMDPPGENFADLLAGYLDHMSPGSAEAAALLQRSWLHWRHGGARRPPFQETLRTLGALLDASGARAALLTVAPDGAAQQTFRELGQRYLEAPELEEQIAARVALRGTGAPPAPSPVDRYEALLRVLGAALDVDGDPAQPYELVVTPRTVMVEDGTGYHQVFTIEHLAALLRASGWMRQSGGPGNGH